MRITWESYPAAAAPGIASADTARAACVFAFVSTECDLDRLGPALAALRTPVIACTTAGQIGRTGFERGGLTTAVIHDGMAVRSFLIRSLADIEASVDETARAVQASGFLDQRGRTVVGVILIDGLSGAEQQLMAALHQRLPLTPIVGGSAGDDLRFEKTGVYWEGAFRPGIAVLHLIATEHPIAPIWFQHHLPMEVPLVTTRVDPSRRVVYELNGIRAVDAYAQALGVAPETVTSPVVNDHPLMLRIGGAYYTRAVRRLGRDGSIELYGGVANGVVLRVGRTDDIVGAVETAFAAARAKVGDPTLVIGCDCTLRRLEIARAGLTAEVGQVMASQRVIGFSGYGEQLNGMHVNHTFAGLMLGAAP